MSTTSFPTIDLKLPPPFSVMYLESGIAIFTCPSNPEGIVTAFPGSMAIDAAGNWYRKNANVTANGWILVSNAVAAPLRRVTANTTIVGNSLAALTTLHTFTLDTPNRLLTNGDFLHWTFGGLFATNANTK